MQSNVFWIVVSYLKSTWWSHCLMIPSLMLVLPHVAILTFIWWNDFYVHQYFFDIISTFHKYCSNTFNRDHFYHNNHDTNIFYTIASLDGTFKTKVGGHRDSFRFISLMSHRFLLCLFTCVTHKARKRFKVQNLKTISIWGLVQF